MNRWILGVLTVVHVAVVALSANAVARDRHKTLAEWGYLGDNHYCDLRANISVYTNPDSNSKIFYRSASRDKVWVSEMQYSNTDFTYWYHVGFPENRSSGWVKESDIFTHESTSVSPQCINQAD